MKTISRLVLSSMLLIVPSARAQDDFNDDSSLTRERLVIDINHNQVQFIEKALLAVTQDIDDVRLFSEPNSNKLVVDAPTDSIPAVLGLVRELDLPVPVVTIHVTEVAMTPDTDLPLSSGKTDAVDAALARAKKAGVLKVIDEMEVTSLSNTPGRIAAGRKEILKPGPQQATKDNLGPELGTTLEVTPRTGKNEVTLSFGYVRLEKIAVSSDGEADSLAISQITLQTFLRIPNGESTVISGMRIGPDNKPVRWKLIVSAAILAE